MQPRVPLHGVIEQLRAHPHLLPSPTELALQVLEKSLSVQCWDNSDLPSSTDSSALMKFIDQECARRCFWLISFMEWLSYIYTHRNVLPRMAQLAEVVRLPIDEVTFELPSVTNMASKYT